MLKVTELPMIPHIISEKMFQTQICFRKEMGRHDKIRSRFASGNVNIVYMASLLLT